MSDTMPPDPGPPGDTRQSAPPAGTASPGPREERRPGPDLNLIRAGATILAVLGVLALLYFASAFFITLFSAMLIAFALDPLVHFICVRARLRRHYASGIVVFLFIAFLYGLAYFAYGMGEKFVADLPNLVEKVQTAPLVERITAKVQDVSRLLDETGRRFVPSLPSVREKAPRGIAHDGETLASTLFHNLNLGSLPGVLFSLSFIPFLVYFILADREPLTRRTRELFPEEYHPMVGVILLDVERVMRRFLIGNAILVGILSAATILVFWAVGLPSPIVLGGLSGTLSVIPYLGLPLALLPGVVFGLVYFETSAPFLVIIGCIALFHLVSANYLTPKLVGGEVHLNATASTVALLFFGWLWGGMGLLLGIPILAVLKCILGNVPSTRRIGMWLGD